MPISFIQRIPVIVGSVAIAFLVGSAVGMWAGRSIQSGACAKILHKDSVAYAEGWKRAAEIAYREAEIEVRRSVSAQQARSRSNTAAEEVIHDTVNDPDPRDCEWRDPQRVRLRSIYDAYPNNPTADPD